MGFVAEDGRCGAALKEYPLDHPFSQATGTDNVILFSTDRYEKQPLVIKGPGAGRDVTAGGVFPTCFDSAHILAPVFDEEGIP